MNNRLKQHYSSCNIQDHTLIVEKDVLIDLSVESTPSIELSDTTLFVKEKRPKMAHIGEFAMKPSKSESIYWISKSFVIFTQPNAFCCSLTHIYQTNKVAAPRFFTA